MRDRCDCRPTVRRLEKTCSGRWLAACPHRAAEAAGETAALLAYHEHPERETPPRKIAGRPYCDRETWR